MSVRDHQHDDEHACHLLAESVYRAAARDSARWFEGIEEQRWLAAREDEHEQQRHVISQGVRELERAWLVRDYQDADDRGELLGPATW